VIEKSALGPIVQEERIVDDHEIHVGVSPVNDEVAAHQERQQAKGQDDYQPAAKAEWCQSIESISMCRIRWQTGLIGCHK
jgi:hypothetical protein